MLRWLHLILQKKTFFSPVAFCSVAFNVRLCAHGVEIFISFLKINKRTFIFYPQDAAHEHEQRIFYISCDEMLK